MCGIGGAEILSGDFGFFLFVNAFLLFIKKYVIPVLLCLTFRSAPEFLYFVEEGQNSFQVEFHGHALL